MALNVARIARVPREDAWSDREPPITLVGTGGGIDEHLQRLRECGMRLRFLRNETIFGEGEPAVHIYRLVGGCVRLARHLPDGRRHVIDFMFPGDTIGIDEIGTYPSAAEAVNTVTVTAYPRLRFDRLGDGNPRFKSDLLSHLSKRLLSAQQHLFVLSCQNAKERLASFVVRLMERIGLGEGNRLDLAMCRQDVADHLGLTIETICRGIAALRRDGILEVPNAHQFALRDIASLRAIAEARTSR